MNATPLGRDLRPLSARPELTHLSIQTLSVSQSTVHCGVNANGGAGHHARQQAVGGESSQKQGHQGGGIMKRGGGRLQEAAARG